MHACKWRKQKPVAFRSQETENLLFDFVRKCEMNTRIIGQQKLNEELKLNIKQAAYMISESEVKGLIVNSHQRILCSILYKNFMKCQFHNLVLFMLRSVYYFSPGFFAKKQTWNKIVQHCIFII
jgi:hypothetical protein